VQEVVLVLQMAAHEGQHRVDAVQCQRAFLGVGDVHGAQAPQGVAHELAQGLVDGGVQVQARGLGLRRGSVLAGRVVVRCMVVPLR